MKKAIGSIDGVLFTMPEDKHLVWGKNPHIHTQLHIGPEILEIDIIKNNNINGKKQSFRVTFFKEEDKISVELLPLRVRPTKELVIDDSEGIKIPNTNKHLLLKGINAKVA
jgi:hypothetical protein